MTFGADNFFPMADFPGLWTVSNSKKCDLLMGITSVAVDPPGPLERRYVGFRRKGGLVDVEGFVVNPDDFEAEASLCELRQEPLRENLKARAWEILYG